MKRPVMSKLINIASDVVDIGAASFCVEAATTALPFTFECLAIMEEAGLSWCECAFGGSVHLTKVFLLLSRGVSFSSTSIIQIHGVLFGVEAIVVNGWSIAQYLLATVLTSHLRPYLLLSKYA